MGSHSQKGSLKQDLFRLLFGKVKVCSHPFDHRSSEVVNASLIAEVLTLNPDIEAECKSWALSRAVAAKPQKISLNIDLIKVKRVTLSSLDVTIKKLKRLRDVSICSNLTFCSLLPQMRKNRIISFRSGGFWEKGTIPIALFYPIIKDKVLKLVLSKKEGMLLVWYSKESEKDEPYCLFLCRKIDKGAEQSDILWQWVPLKDKCSGGGRLTL